jgi:hypothetical protein
VSSLLFNLNPLLRFDGYHMLVDALDVPNLFQRSRDQLRYLGEHLVFRLPHARPAARSPVEAWLLPLYGVASLTYWLVLMATIVFFIAEQYLDLGVAMAWVLGFTVTVVPLFKFLKYLFSSPRLMHLRARSMAITVGLVGSVLLVLAGVPVPDRVRASASTARRRGVSSPCWPRQGLRCVPARHSCVWRIPRSASSSRARGCSESNCSRRNCVPWQWLRRIWRLCAVSARRSRP